MLLDLKNKKVTKAWVFQVCFGNHIAARDCKHTITKTFWPSDPANTCENKQVSVTKKKPTSDSLALILEFKNLSFFSLFMDKILVPLKSAQTPFDFDKAKISFDMFCFLLTCMCVQVYSKFKATSTGNLETYQFPGSLKATLSRGLFTGRQGMSPTRYIMVNWFWTFLDTFHFEAILCPSAYT